MGSSDGKSFDLKAQDRSVNLGHMIEDVKLPNLWLDRDSLEILT